MKHTAWNSSLLSNFFSPMDTNTTPQSPEQEIAEMKAGLAPHVQAFLDHEDAVQNAKKIKDPAAIQAAEEARRAFFIGLTENEQMDIEKCQKQIDVYKQITYEQSRFNQGLNRVLDVTGSTIYSVAKRVPQAALGASEALFGALGGITVGGIRAVNTTVTALTKVFEPSLKQSA